MHLGKVAGVTTFTTTARLFLLLEQPVGGVVLGAKNFLLSGLGTLVR
jgi:hypothetical protein